MSFQWDIFIIETGFLVIFFIPGTKNGKEYHDLMSITIRRLLQWLSFRFFFSSGVVKLLRFAIELISSGCPTWWGLTALNYHFESQCIPNSLSWTAHYWPEEIKKYLVAMTFITLIFGSLLFYAPFRQIRQAGVFLQLGMQIAIIVTGNYNWLLPFLEDDVISTFTPKFVKTLFYREIEFEQDIYDKSESTVWKDCIIAMAVVVIGVGACFYFLFPPSVIASGINTFTKDQLLNFSRIVLQLFAGITMLYVLIDVIAFGVKYWKDRSGLVSRYLQRGLSLTFASFMIIASLYPTSYNVGFEIDSPMLKSYSRSFYTMTEKLHIVNSYGLFRAMTGIEGREELIIQGSYDRKEWKEYEFIYKPGNLSVTPKFCVPHQPRLDWQMWFAALRPRIHTEEWLINLVHKLFEGSIPTTSLLAANPFEKQPPQFIRIVKYIYAFTTPEEFNKTKEYWKRKPVSQFMSIISREDPVLKDYLNRVGMDMVIRHNGKYGINPQQNIPVINIAFGFIVMIFIKNLVIESAKWKAARMRL